MLDGSGCILCTGSISLCFQVSVIPIPWCHGYLVSASLSLALSGFDPYAAAYAITCDYSGIHREVSGVFLFQTLSLVKLQNLPGEVSSFTGLE